MHIQKQHFKGIKKFSRKHKFIDFKRVNTARQLLDGLHVEHMI